MLLHSIWKGREGWGRAKSALAVATRTLLLQPPYLQSTLTHQFPIILSYANSC